MLVVFFFEHGYAVPGVGVGGHENSEALEIIKSGFLGLSLEAFKEANETFGGDVGINEELPADLVGFALEFAGKALGKERGAAFRGHGDETGGIAEESLNEGSRSRPIIEKKR